MEAEGANRGGGTAAWPLAGVRVVDLTRVMTGPYCTLMLGDLGADVVKVELPGKGDDTRAWGPPFLGGDGGDGGEGGEGGESVYFLSVNRNKRSIALDLKHEAGRAVLWRLLETADVLVENFSPGTIARLGFDAETVRARFPRLVYASISGFGQSGPDHARTAYDLILQGMSGMMSITGHPGAPPTRLGVPIADIGAGMFAAYAIVAALFRRERTGTGGVVDTSMLSGQVALLTYQAGLHLATGETPRPLGNAHPMITPYDTFSTADGYCNIAVGNDAIWRRFCAAIDRPDLLDDDRFASNPRRVAHRPALYAALVPTLAAFTTAELVGRLDAAAVPCGPIRDVAAVLADPQVRDQGLIQEVEHATLGPLRLAGAPYHFDGVPVAARRPPPLLGQHTAEVLAEVGYAADEVAALIDAGAATVADENDGEPAREADHSSPDRRREEGSS